ncbi:Uncharacterised protein [Klebsiella michiganensis]|uniref:Uncharacterized protein n=1 Tax=Klebsiella michiganensis TaxID=1134687 RepID=A0A7H4MZH3_9ENTR|nr:Uncharacterised protein [Klebsiella michiganensis]
MSTISTWVDSWEAAMEGREAPSRQVSVMLCQCYNQLTNSD